MKKYVLSLFLLVIVFWLTPKNQAFATPVPDSISLQKEVLENLPVLVKRLGAGLSNSGVITTTTSVPKEAKDLIPFSQFDLPELDERLNAAFDRSKSTLGNYGDTPDAEFTAQLMVKLNAYNANGKVKKARKVLDKAISLGNFIKKLTGDDMVSFPLVLSDTISNNVYSVIFNKMELYPAYTELEVMVRIWVPSQNREIFFGAPDIKFTKTGGFVGEVKLGLYAELPIVFGQNKAALILNKWQPAGTGQSAGDTGTYVVIDCDGFVEMGLEADFVMSREWVIPTDNVGNPLDEGRVTAHVQTIIYDWNDMLIDLTLPDFAITGLPDVAFNLHNAVLDFSDFRNSYNMVFPKTYNDQTLMPGNSNLWRGVYIKNLEVMLPPQFSKRNCQSSGPGEHCRFTFGTEDLLIDESGVSGYFYVENVFALDDGKMDTWKFSLDHIEIDVVVNEVMAFGFGGEVGIPVAKQEKPFGYAAFRNIENDTYSFSVITRSDMEFSFLQAVDVAIDSSSKLNVVVTSDAFIPTAELTGSLSINAKFDPTDEGEDNIVELVGLDFTKLLVRTESPKLSIDANGGNIALTSGLNLAGLPVSISDVMLSGVPGESDQIELSFNVNVNFLGEEDGGFAATTNFGIVGRLEEEVDGVDQVPTDVWVYDHLEFNAAEIHMQFSDKLTLDGFVEVFHNDAVYGKGYQGNLTVNIIDKFTIQASAIFGNTGQYNYWNFDALF